MNEIQLDRRCVNFPFKQDGPILAPKLFKFPVVQRHADRKKIFAQNTPTGLSTLHSPNDDIRDRFATHLLPYSVAKYSLRSANTAIVTVVTRNISSAFSPFFQIFFNV
jgi:hypothetical protein